METSIITALISGTFALLVAVVPVLLKHRLERTRETGDVAPIGSATTSRSVPATTAPATRAPATTVSSSLRRRIALLTIGFACGVLIELLGRTQLLSVGNRGFGLGFLFFLALCALCLWLVFVHRSLVSDSSSYQVELLILWPAAFSGFSLVRGGIWSDAVGSFGIAWAVSAIVGGLLLAILRRR